MRIVRILSAVVLLTLCASAETTTHHYQDAENGVGFDYADVWHVPDAEKDADYLRPSIQPVRFAVFFNKSSNPYPGTDFASLSFNYAIAPAKTAAACAAAITAYGDTAPSVEVTVNGRKFNAAEGGDAAMSHQISERVYSTFANNRCYVFDLELATAGFGAEDDIRQMRQSEKDEAQQSLDAIFDTVRIADLK